MVEQKVPKLFNELQALCEDYTKQYAVYDIVVEGLRADQYAESVMRAYEEDREVQRAQKVLFSHQQINGQLHGISLVFSSLKRLRGPR